MKTNSARAPAVVLAIVVLAFSVQAMYWPLLMKPATVLSWWQVKWMAEVGFYVGAPALVAMQFTPFSGAAQELYAWFCIVAWSAIVYIVIGIVLQVVRRVRGKRVHHAT